MNDKEDGARGWADAWIALALALYSLGIAIWLLANDIRLTQEDGFYYFKIAQNVAAGLGSTFDEVNPTNGYHPLWLLCLVPLFWLSSTPTAILPLIGLMQAIFMAAGVVLLYYTARLSAGRYAASFAGLLWLWFVYRVSLGGLEFSLHALCLLASAYLYLRWFGANLPQPRQGLGLGVLLGLTFLARLDTLLLALIIWVWLFGRELKRGLGPTGIQRFLAVGGPVALVSLIYLGLNLALFGHPLPVSSMIKRTWSASLLAHDPRYLADGWLAAKVYLLSWPLFQFRRLYPFYLALGVFGAGSSGLIGLGLPRNHWLRQWLGARAPFILFSLANFLVYGLLYHGGLSFPPWYFVVQPWLAALLIGELVDKIVLPWVAALPARLRVLTQDGLKQPQEAQSPGLLTSSSSGPSSWAQLRWLVVIGFVALWSVAPFYTARSLEQWRARERLNRSPDRPLLEAAQWAGANLPPEAIIGAWNAGHIGYLSGRRVVNLDGVVNSWDYYLAGRHDLCRYWQAQKISHLVDVFEGEQALSVAPTYPTYADCAGRLDLLWANDRYNASWSVKVYKIAPVGKITSN